MAMIDTLIADAIARRVFPGAVVLVAANGAYRHFSAYGTTMYDDPGSAPVDHATIYDLASLTKVFTATAALCLLDAGLIRLDDPAARFLPGLRAEEIRLRHLLTHTAGLDLRLALLRELGPAGLRAAVYQAQPLRPPGSYVAYTNVNSMLLGDVVAHVYGAGLDQALAALVLAPLDMGETGFRPAPALHPRIAPSEWDHAWRGELVRGAVHDESAYALGGVAGHAGLFSSAADLERFCRMWLHGGTLGGRQVLREATVALATRDYTAGLPSPTGGALHSGLGWMLDRPGFMGRAPRGTFGHTGFTGPVMLCVPQHDLAVIILSNRTYPLRRPPPYPHHAVTAAVVEQVLGE